MRVLVLRPEMESARVATILAARGHEAILSPIIRIERTGAAIPAGPFDCVVATSANALTAIVGGVPRSLLSLPLHGVGSQVGEAAERAGFTQIASTAPNAAELAQRMAQAGLERRRAIYLTGAPRKPDLESGLRAAGFEVTPVETYRAMPVAELSPDAARQLREGVDIVLHFSRASAVAAMQAFEATRTLDAVAMARHLCLSGDIASALVGRPDWFIEIARQPTLDHLIELIDRPAVAA